MGENNTKSIGSVIIVVGIVILLIGISIPSTSTHTSETCIDDPFGPGQDCTTSTVTTSNPLSGWATGLGGFSIIGGVVVTLLGFGEKSNQTPEHRLRLDERGDDSSSVQIEDTKPEGSFAEKVEQHKNNR